MTITQTIPQPVNFPPTQLGNNGKNERYVRSQMIAQVRVVLFIYAQVTVLELITLQ